MIELMILFDKIKIKRYEILEHTGDAKIRVFGKTKEELFLNAMLGMIAVLRPKIKNKKTKIKNIKVEAADLNALLVDFLSEVNYLVQTNLEVYNSAKFIKFSDTGLEVELSGQKVKEFGEEIKAVTYHGLEIVQNPQGFWEATIIFDI